MHSTRENAFLSCRQKKLTSETFFWDGHLLFGLFPILFTGEFSASKRLTTLMRWENWLFCNCLRRKHAPNALRWCLHYTGYFYAGKKTRPDMVSVYSYEERSWRDFCDRSEAHAAPISKVEWVWVNNTWGRRPNELLTQRPWGGEE